MPRPPSSAAQPLPCLSPKFTPPRPRHWLTAALSSGCQAYANKELSIQRALECQLPLCFQPFPLFLPRLSFSHFSRRLSPLALCLSNSFSLTYYFLSICLSLSPATPLFLSDFACLFLGVLMCLSAVGQLQNIKTSSPLLPHLVLDRLVSAPSLPCVLRRVSSPRRCACTCACRGCSERRLLFFKHASVCARRLRSQVFVPYALCLPVRDCVGGLALAAACVVLRALSTPPPPTCLWHACVVQSLTPAFVNRGKSRAWVIGDYSGEERERLTQQYNDREVGGDEGEVAGDRRTAGGEEETE